VETFRSLTVLSIEQATALPFLTLRLAQEGMRVIRLENPPHGDPNRWVGQEVIPSPDNGPGHEPGMNAYFLPNNLGKESITLSLGTAEGRDLLHRLVRELPVDIFATNQRPSSNKKLGVDYASLRQLKPDLIWVGITGFGMGHEESAYDPIVQARAGFMELTGDPHGDPMVFGLPMVDLGAGEHAYGQVMKSLYQRAVTGHGALIDISMFQSAVSWMVSPVMLNLSFGQSVTRRGNVHPFFAPVSVYPTADGHIYLAVGNDRQWEALVHLPDFEALEREAYRHNAGRIADVDELNQRMAAITRLMSTEDLVSKCQHIGLPVSRVNSLSEVCADPLIANQLVRARDSRSGMEIAIAPPPLVPEYLRGSKMRMKFPPRLGEHNELVFGALGSDIAGLRARGVL